jgi:ketosteroid isomerase-like protein
MALAQAPKNPTIHLQQPFTKSDDKAAVEATVRDYEEAVQLFDFSRADSLLAPNAKWIERSMPEAAAMGEGAGFWAEAKEAKVRVRNEPHDFDIRIQGDVAWVTLLVDVTMLTDNEKARTLLARSETEETGKTSDPNQRVWRATYTESEVLVKTPNGWRIALGHTSRLPTKTN